ncbi:MAG TPA: amino acid permease [Streptosporangiaceae bacterium]|nr:amino acid permease [Streptosporangiaceae bacterium]
MRRATGLLTGDQASELPETFWYSAKRRLLGPPMINAQLQDERLSKTLALGVLSPDGISSSAYGTEEILIELLPIFGIAAFAVLVPMTGVILFVMLLVVLSYREVVTVYTRAGGSYVVARENFGPRIAQVAAVALLIDYVVTVAVQVAAGTAAVASTFPGIGPYSKEITIGVILLMCFGNLRGIREAGKIFALPTYLFSGVIILMIVVGLIRAAAGTLPQQDVNQIHGLYTIGPGASAWTTFALIFALLRSFANGGSSLTGIEAVSNAVSAFRPPEGINARRVLVTEGLILGTLVAGISWLAHLTHAAPYEAGYPTVISQEASMVFGQTAHFMFYVVQAATALILFTGGNTSFNGFPFLTSFVAEDSFLPRWMMKRGQRLVFSNGIIVLTVLSVTLIAVVGASVNALVPFYAIGVFTAFSMAGFGMARYHVRHKEPGWRHKLVINFSAGVMTSIVVAIFAWVKFTSGAWFILIIFPVGVFALIRLNRQYRSEAGVLEYLAGRRAAGEAPRQPNYSRRVVIVFVDDFDLATIAALRYARSLRPTSLRAVHFVIDTEKAEQLRAAWQPDRSVPLDFVDCPDRRLSRAAAELAAQEAETPGTQVTVILPRRSFSPLLGRLLHDHTADKMAGAVSRIPNAAAVVIPFDVQNRIHVLQERQAAREGKPGQAVLAAADGGQVGPDAVTAQRRDAAAETTATAAAQPGDRVPDQAKPRGAPRLGRRKAAADRGPAGGPERLPGAGTYDRPVPPPGVDPIGSLRQPGRATVEGRVRVLEIRPVEQNSVLVAEISDSTGDLTAMFYGRSKIPGLMCGSKVRFRGSVGIKNGAPVMVNPAYELLVPGVPGAPPGDG